MNTFMIALRVFVFFTLITGVVYPLTVTGVGQLLWKEKANGSLIIRNEKVIGSSLIQQEFSDPKYFHGRPQEVSNLSPRSKALAEKVELRAKEGAHGEMLYGSGSSLDPHISPRSAFEQVDRIAMARHLPAETIHSLVQQNVELRQFGVLGEPRVNVLVINTKLEELK